MRAELNIRREFGVNNEPDNGQNFCGQLLLAEVC
jgi:hypothetical protein